MKVGVIACIMWLCLATPAIAMKCNVCHSKNPKMVRMHEKLGFKDCFSCHGPGKKKNAEELRVQQQTDPLCTGCHKG